MYARHGKRHALRWNGDVLHGLVSSKCEAVQKIVCFLAEIVSSSPSVILMALKISIVVWHVLKSEIRAYFLNEEIISHDNRTLSNKSMCPETRENRIWTSKVATNGSGTNFIAFYRCVSSFIKTLYGDGIEKFFRIWPSPRRTSLHPIACYLLCYWLGHQWSFFTF